MARISKLANPEFAKAVAEAYINGLGREEMADIFGVHKDTITDWTRDPRVQGHAARMAQERVTRITRKIDKVIEGRLQESEDLDTELLLKIRKEFLDRSLKVDLSKANETAETINEAATLLESDPKLAEAFKELMTGAEK